MSIVAQEQLLITGGTSSIRRRTRGGDRWCATAVVAIEEGTRALGRRRHRPSMRPDRRAGPSTCTCTCASRLEYKETIATGTAPRSLAASRASRAWRTRGR
jgi:hypothetical protein